LVEGDLNHLKPSPLVIPPPVRAPGSEPRRGIPTAPTGHGMVPDVGGDYYDEYLEQGEDGYFVP
jgi:hypothetical protein